MVDPAPPIYHLCTLSEWRAAEAEGVYNGSSQDAADGFIHFSTKAQAPASAAKHRAGQTGLVLLSVHPALLGEALKWEQAGGGDLFPHLHGPLPVSAVSAAEDLALGPDGRHVFPPGFPADLPPSGDPAG